MKRYHLELEHRFRLVYIIISEAESELARDRELRLFCYATVGVKVKGRKRRAVEMSEIPGLYEGVEAVKVVVEGTEVFLRLGGDVLNWTLDKMVTLAKLLARNIRSWEEELKEGEVHFKDLLDKDNGRIEMLQIEQEHLDKLKAFAKQAGVSYSIMPDLNKKDKYVEVAYPERQGDAFRYFIAQNADIAKTYTYGEYFNNALEEDIEAEIRGLGRDTVKYAHNQVQPTQVQQPTQIQVQSLQSVQYQQPTQMQTQNVQPVQYQPPTQMQKQNAQSMQYQQPMQMQAQNMQPVQVQQPQRPSQFNGQQQYQRQPQQQYSAQVPVTPAQQYHNNIGTVPQTNLPSSVDLVPVDASLLSKSKTNNWVKVAIPNTKDDYIVVHKSAIYGCDGQLYVDLSRLQEYTIFDAKENQKYDANKNVMQTSTQELKVKIAEMSKKTRENLAKEREIKGTVKFVNKDAQGRVTERIMKPAPGERAFSLGKDIEVAAMMKRGKAR